MHVSRMKHTRTRKRYRPSVFACLPVRSAFTCARTSLLGRMACVGCLHFLIPAPTPPYSRLSFVPVTKLVLSGQSRWLPSYPAVARRIRCVWTLSFRRDLRAVTAFAVLSSGLLDPALLLQLVLLVALCRFFLLRALFSDVRWTFPR